MSISTVPSTFKNQAFGGDAPGAITLLDDWSYFPSDDFSYGAPGIVAVSGLDASKIVAVGGQLRITQDGTKKYFYAARVTTSGVYVRAGKDYQLSTSQITGFEVGNRIYPTDFPIQFNFTPNFVASAGSYGNLDSGIYERCKFQMIGNLCIMHVDVTRGLFSSGAGIQFTPPLPADFIVSEPNMTIVVSDNFNPRQGYMKFGGRNIVEVGQWAGTPATLSAFTATTNGLGFSALFSYIIDPNLSLV